MNFYGVAIGLKHTYVSSARWGKTQSDAMARAKNAVIHLVPSNEPILEIKVIKANSRKEVSDIYEC